MRAATLAVALALAGPAVAQDPLSAIDWLRDTMVQPTAGVLPLSPAETAEPADAAITSRPLDALRAESVGLYPAGRVGLAGTIWGPSTTDEIAALIRILPTDTLPALRDLTYRLLLAEFEAPRPGRAMAGAPNGGGTEAYLLARIDALMAFGALDQAGALLVTLDSSAPALVARQFDLRLLLGEDEGACADLTRAVSRAVADDAEPGEAEALSAAGSLQAAAIFCQARAGDWTGAERSLVTARGGPVALPQPYLELLERFVDFDAHTEDDPAPMPERPSPLVWRILEALGEPVATQGLPVAFAHADLRGTAGWRAQIEAAERLVRTGALPANHLLGLYTERRPAASGGIWERVRRVQVLDDTLTQGDSAAIGAALLAAWPQVADAELEVPFASLFARQLMAAGLEGAAAELAATVGLLSEDYELAALALEGAQAPPRLRRLAALARGQAPDAALGSASDAEAAVLDAFATDEPLPEAIAARLAEGRVGEELLRVLIRVGASGDPRMLAEGLTVLRHVGLEDIARRTALQAILLERRG